MVCLLRCCSALTAHRSRVDMTMQAATRVPMVILTAGTDTCNAISAIICGFCAVITATVTYPFHVAHAVSTGPHPAPVV